MQFLARRKSTMSWQQIGLLSYKMLPFPPKGEKKTQKKEGLQLNMGLGIVGRKYLRCNDSIGSLSVMNSVPAHRSRWIRTRARCRLSASLLVYVVIWRSSGSTASHQWLLKACK
uniref:Uncharacterized protein n=1 Tax=Opuntia streptacantha TaxID=393608 RepID=A0A7C8Z9I9_OPUST